MTAQMTAQMTARPMIEIMKTRVTRFAATVVLAAVLGVAATLPAAAAEAVDPPSQEWSFDGIFGTFDRDQLQRGFQVYRDICAACHSLRQIYFRNLTDIGLSETQVKAIAAEVQVPGEPDEFGDPTTRPGQPYDKLPAPYPNDQAARSANGGALPPDLSLMVKARPGGADYLHAFLTGYKEPPEGAEITPGMSYNEYFPGQQTAMPLPLSEGMVEYEDGTPASVEQMSRDVTAFLAWTAEPEMEDRKRLGIKVLLFLLVFTGLLYALKRSIWSEVH